MLYPYTLLPYDIKIRLDGDNDVRWTRYAANLYHAWDSAQATAEYEYPNKRPRVYSVARNEDLKEVVCKA